MRNGLIEKIGRGRVALGLPLLGLIVMWLVITGAQLSDMYLQYGKLYADSTAQQNQFHLSTYLFLIGVVVLGITSVWSRRLGKGLKSNRMERAIRVFSLVAVIASLIICAIFGFGTFMSNFMTNWYSGSGKPGNPNELMRVFNVYLPILLDAAFMVVLILLAFVNKADDDEHEGKEKSHG